MILASHANRVACAAEIGVPSSRVAVPSPVSIESRGKVTRNVPSIRPSLGAASRG